MKPLKIASILMIPVAGTLVGYGTVNAQGNSDAAQGCLQGQQTVYYSGPALPGSVDSVTGKYSKIFPNHGQCTSFFAMDKAFVFESAVPGIPVT